MSGLGFRKCSTSDSASTFGLVECVMTLQWSAPVRSLKRHGLLETGGLCLAVKSHDVLVCRMLCPGFGHCAQGVLESLDLARSRLDDCTPSPPL